MEYATVSGGSVERARPIKREGELSAGNFGANGRPQSSDGNNTTHISVPSITLTQSVSDHNVADTKNRFITSAALKKRGQKSQVCLKRIVM
uniref:Uncharacterized protein n=1 Tax=Panagrolaimus sp. PS1159 TaxID=55785 RepID=A0AC35FX48_9BILA